MTVQSDFTLDSRRQIIDHASSFDDAVVFLGLVAAGKVAGDGVADAFRTEKRIERIAGEHLAAGLVQTQEWTAFQQLWYRMRVPFGVAPLTWWNLFCLAFGHTGEMERACDLAARWIEALAATAPEERVRVHCEQTGQSAARGVVAMREDLLSLECFARATLEKLPLVSVHSTEELAAVRRDGTVVVLSDVDAVGGVSRTGLPMPSRRMPTLHAFCGGRPFSVAGGTSQMRDFWCAMPPEERTYILVHLEQNIAALEIVRFSYGNRVYDNAGQAALMSACRATAPEQWSQCELTFASVLWGWSQAGFMVHEFNQSELSLHSFRVFLERRTHEYELVTGASLPADLPLPELVQRFASLRKTVEKTQQRCIYFDGGNFERREFLLAKSDILAARAIPDALRRFMAERFGVEMPDATPTESFKRYLGLIGEHGKTPTDLLVALADWIANAEDLKVDIAVLDVPRGGVKLDKPWTLELDDIACVSAFRSGWDPKAAKLPLDRIGVSNAIGMRMRYNAVKKAQNYALIKSTTPQSFLLPDISVGEDANHGGHHAAGIRHAARVPMAMHYKGSEWRGIADVRLSRTDYSYANRFREGELLLATRYGAWCKAIADETYARGLEFDQRYCVNLSDGRDVEARLGRPAKRGQS
jgi:hypothetical protein